MFDEKNKFTDASFENCDLKNPADRDTLKQAADELLKMHRGKEEVCADVEEEKNESTDLLATLQDENKELKDQFLRLAADMENLRRRTIRDVADAKIYSIANFARDMLSVSDNLNRALEAIPADARESDTNLKMLAEGVEMTERAMMAALEHHGVKKICPEGQKFDPNFHQAMFEISNSDVPDNTVQQVVQAGYIIGERVLRPAMVGVAKGGPKENSTEADSA
ncbi:protein grpE [Bartonella bacilliformis str. Heidi Mejia]|uniref:Protein GrpE n=2 Tax=Bartonella bacilliformis TaxID=774 RepID=GRPE_BARBK|nr:nucleotide exchange factor GrpE [Bartonella bacilliformis]A1UUC9.1 RecName: Full=Protein GrpE; AltName: Full=HSP-70 cofactor [Bartonella bacilliformis KC583]ABM45300.1 co-chaperone GrpE [Bartonella bacilliformis KC583]AMG86294.1 nucleotide exchange factor GrpE [Bartonella bacilliformis]EKS43211.1 heat shock protein GrpE [Bartonella bacilliformis INS]EYS88902.1 protein grpE [Bartonella bacilliformis San Pedro600-02]EYS90863.1 protein grpE [Bartonella bacilliformis str. Heidi Mejia]